MQVNLTFRAPEIEGATPTIMVEMILGGKAPSPMIKQVLEAAVGQCCAAVRTEAYDPWTIGLSLLVHLRNHGFDVKLT